MSRQAQALLCAISFLIVSFGQPAFSSWASLAAALAGYALFWKVQLTLPSAKGRFWAGTCWFAAVQLVQLSWMVSHPFLYIWAVYFLLAFAVGAQFGLLSLFFDPRKALTVPRILVIASFWTLMEWSRLYVFSGYSWNPAGLALAGNVYAMQLASFVGVYGLSFLVMTLNLFLLRAWRVRFLPASTLLYLCLTAFPFLLGAWQYAKRAEEAAAHLMQPQSTLSALLVQTSFPVEESLCFNSHQAFADYVFSEWEQILTIAGSHYGKEVDLVALPEFVVPFGTYSFAYDYEKVRAVFAKCFGAAALEKLPGRELPLAYFHEEASGGKWLVNNAFWSQGLANLFEANVVVGLEDAEDSAGERRYYSSALYFTPEKRWENGAFAAKRYAKRVLVPMGEYIPFSFCRELAASYGVMGSFTPGEEAQVFNCAAVPVGFSICYEETFSEMMRENRRKGAELMVNLTSDAWFPRSRLIRQHLEHSRLRTVENGMPLLRACNTGITCGVDALGRDVAVLGASDSEREGISDALFVKIPLYHYRTLYSRLGDGLIVGISLLVALIFFRLK